MEMVASSSAVWVAIGGWSGLMCGCGVWSGEAARYGLSKRGWWWAQIGRRRGDKRGLDDSVPSNVSENGKAPKSVLNMNVMASEV